MSKFPDAEFKTSSISNIHPSPLCVAVAQLGDGTVEVKHSSDTESKNILKFTKQEWRAFIGGAKMGEFDV